MNTTPLLILAATAALTLFAGCMTAPGPFQPLDTTKYTLENTEKFVLLDKPAQFSVTARVCRNGSSLTAALKSWPT